MKIAILTYHAVYNFGANLQTLSTYNYLLNSGHDPIIIDFISKKLEDAFDKTVPANQASVHKQFIKNNFNMTNRCRDSKEIAKEIARNKIEAVIIGSDAVVQYNSLLNRIKISPSRKKILSIKIDPIYDETNFPSPYWGEFVEYLEKRIPVSMMSVSCQNTNYSLIFGKTKKLIMNLIDSLVYISVRDKRTQELFQHVTDNKISPKITPDPVFAFNENICKMPSRNEIINKYQLPKNYYLLSFNSPKTVSKSWVNLFDSIAKKNGFNCVALTMPGGIKFDHDLEYTVKAPLDPIDWYCIIRYSAAYIGEKMHPIIVSLHNNVPFFSFDNYGTKLLKLFVNQKASKIYHILERSDLLNQRISILNKKNTPSPNNVFERLVSFDHTKCMKIAAEMKFDYTEMMKELLVRLQAGGAG